MPTVHGPPVPLPLFADDKAGSQISEIAFRVVVELEGGWELYVVGTATLISPHLAITARHVLEDALKYGAKLKGNKVEADCALMLYQMLPGPIYRIWRVCSAWPCASDIALLHFCLHGASPDHGEIIWKRPGLRMFPPPAGQTVVAFGYRESKITVPEGRDGVRHI